MVLLEESLISKPKLKLLCQNTMYHFECMLICNEPVVNFSHGTNPYIAKIKFHTKHSDMHIHEAFVQAYYLKNFMHQCSNHFCHFQTNCTRTWKA